MSRPRLSVEQRSALLNTSQLSFVESAPGSGKTTVAVERFGVLHHARSNGLEPRGIISVSFARSAVAELRIRTAARWGTRSLHSPNRVATMDRLHRCVVEYLLLTGLVTWPVEVKRPQVIDSWARQRGATRVSPGGQQDQRWEIGMNGTTLAADYRRVERACWGMPYRRKDDWMERLLNGVCTHDEIRQIVGLALGKPDLRHAIDTYLARTYHHLIVDEVFDLNGLDAHLVRRCIEAGLNVTLVGDPWQALYEWRGARPDMVHDLLDDYPFDRYSISNSFRFKTSESIELARSLRAREAVSIPNAMTQPDVVLAAEWDHIPASGPDAIPLSFGQLDCQTDAAIALLLNVVAQARLGVAALGQAEAARCLRRDREEIDLDVPLQQLRDPAVPREEVMEALRVATKVGGERKPALPAARRSSRLDRLDLLRYWLLTEKCYVPGLTFHQAKGKEWPHVHIALNVESRAALAQGLDPQIEDHRKIYVGSTRGILSTQLRPL
ncbi:UvrD-helicase domain-containing protein [Candidatus Poriferisocius sp.]|uniref:UvrD-helicase domain-containing protein n=1 Tax=Candidatus Poriferisocius sp. TaxID=3101276 RepID=UPI003B5B466B